MQIREIELIDLTGQKAPLRTPDPLKDLPRNLSYTANEMLKLQHKDGYWWFSLQANEAIGAGYIFVKRFLGIVDKEIESGIANRILDVQREDGTWSLYFEGPPDLSTTIECYFALKITGFDINNPNLRKAREFILSKGGLTASRVFTRIHLAMFGLVPWSSCPEMPPELILMPSWSPVNIYEFSSWARASIVPLCIFMSLKPVRKISDNFNLDELFCEPPSKRDYSFKSKKGFVSWECFFIYLDKLLKLYEKIPLKPLRKLAINKCAKWTWDHIQRTEDIYPALAYGALAFSALGCKNDSKYITVPLKALDSFQQCYTTSDVPRLCYDEKVTSNESQVTRKAIHQQCCISPVWDTPWTIMALLEAGIPADSPALVKAGRWLISKQITGFRGDWAVKNPNALPGGWSFEFKNDYFPDVDDTIEIVSVLMRLAIPENEKEPAIKRGVSWILSMQNDDGGWGAFDKNQKLTLVNKIPFSDHGACLDPSSPDITARVVELLASRGMGAYDPPVAKALKYLEKTQEKFGGWFARWGINYIYGTWCVLTGLSELGWSPLGERIVKAVAWLKSIQNEDGGFGESPESYKLNTYVKWKRSVPTQTAWGLMGLVAGGAAA
jgi:squalene-hopene/tetraprenyl-beta-curcumene cyclase